jgi:hypothetical protein
MATGTLSTVARSLPVGGVDVAGSAALMVHVARSRWDRPIRSVSIVVESLNPMTCSNVV